MTEHLISVNDDGSLVFIYSDELAFLSTLGETTTTRASHVEPGPDNKWYADMSPTAQKCRVCLETLSLDSFAIRSDGGTRRLDCKECRSKAEVVRRQAKRINDPEWHSREKEKGRKYQTTKNRESKLRVFQHYSKLHNGSDVPRCACCGVVDMEFLTLDHIDKNGREHRAEVEAQGFAKGAGMYLWIEKNGYPEGFRVLCWNCNCSRGIHGYCPHEQNPVLGPFDLRQTALDEEVDWLKENVLQ